MLSTYQELVENFNAVVPEDLALPKIIEAGIVEVGDDDAQMQVVVNDQQVEKIILISDPEKIEGTYYKLFVDGLEDGMGWSSMNFYNAAMATLKDQKVHIGVNNQNIAARHELENKKLIVTVTREE